MIVAPGQCYGRVGLGAWDIDMSADTLADVTVTHGRQFFESGRAAVSTAQFTIRRREGTPADWFVAVGTPAVVDSGPPGARYRRHTGTISDVSWGWDEDGRGRYLAHRVTTTGGITRMGSSPVGWGGGVWAQQTARDRAYTIAHAAGWGDRFWVQPGDFNPTLRAEERDPAQDALSALEALTWAGEAVLYDTPEGWPLWQELGWRRTTPTINLPACAVRWAPEFRSMNDLVNAARIEYGPDTPGGERPSAYHGDGGSFFAYGVWEERWAADYADQTSAQTKATRIVRRQARPQTLLPAVTVLPNLLEPAQWAAIAALRVGDRVRLPQLPEPVPAGVPGVAGVMVVEGWTERIGSKVNPDREWTLDLHLSPPVWSMVSRRWDEVPGAWQDQTATWDQIGAL